MLVLSYISLIFFIMKNPTEPNIKTEKYPVLMILLSTLAAYYFTYILPDKLILSWTDAGQPEKYISWASLAYTWPIVLSLVYSMFLFFPYFKINHVESKNLKEQWHKAKDLSLSFFFILQVIGGLILTGQNIVLFWALPILFCLSLISFKSTITEVLHYRKKHPVKF